MQRKSHTTSYVVLRMRRVVWHMHDVCTIHIRQNSAHDHVKLLMFKWLALSVTVGLGLGTGNAKRMFHSFFFSDKHLCLALLARGLFLHLLVPQSHLWQYDVSVM